MTKAPANQEAYQESPAFQDRITNGNGVQYTDYTPQSDEPYANNRRLTTLSNGASSTVISCCASEQDKSPPVKAAFGDQSGQLMQMDFQNYLNNNGHDHYATNGTCFGPEPLSSEVAHSLPEVPELPDTTKGPPLLESLQEVTPV